METTPVSPHVPGENRPSRPLRSLLAVAGLVLSGIGAATLFAPESFHAVNGIVLDGGTALLSESRAAGGLLLSSGVLITLGAFVARLTRTATAVGALAYLSYALSRLLSAALDGLPPGGLVVAGLVELVLGLACAAFLVRAPSRG
ncbi:DUF4345 domain-containing protein [Actinocorallia populi]|uniref:DUF4345 domain-containing protein n=1 Tax=Actinocorallia populi TaxID=2079200 RepID=UPI0013004788|nr:DUF4345 domain-containing protein [Actinocorallia populi]